MYRQYGFNTPAEALADGAYEVIHLVSRISRSVDLNMPSTDRSHKTDKGNVLPISALLVPRW